MRTMVASAVLIAAFTFGCHKHADNAPGTGSGQQAQTAADSGAAAPGPGGSTAVSGAAKATDSGATAPDAGGSEASAGTAAAAGDAPATEEACVDAWLQARNLDTYGNAEGTMYMGGTPLFNERTGERTDRLAFVYKKHPDAKKACAGK